MRIAAELRCPPEPVSIEDETARLVEFATQAARRFPGPPGRLRFTLRVGHDRIIVVCRTDGTIDSVATVQMTGCEDEDGASH